MTEQESYWVWLSSIDGMGSVTFHRILGEFGDAKTACDHYRDIPKKLKINERLAENIQKCASRAYWDGLFGLIQKGGIKVLTRLSQDYPQTLADVDNPPPVLYFKGNIPDMDMACAVVGSRRPTKKGFMGARNLSAELAAQDVVIVSGMARGVDTAAHTGALEAGGKTIAVLGCGVDVVYPPENIKLYEQILENGAVLSEFVPGEEPQAKNFPQRNRIVAGLSHLLLAGEGGEKSGARITVDFALKQGKDVYVMPCDLKSSMAKLPLYLMEAGAPMVENALDVMNGMGWEIKQARIATEDGGHSMEGDQAKVYAALSKEALTADELAGETGIEAKDLSVLLTVMEINGLIAAGAGGTYEVNK